jgi:Carboxypeptidase regulatory-like domain
MRMRGDAIGAAARRRRRGGLRAPLAGALALLLAALAVPRVAWAQRRGAGDLVGRIVSGTTREPIAGARVQLVGTHLALFTDTAGGFSLEGLPTGRTLTFEARAVGFRMGRFDVVLPPGTPVDRVFALDPLTVALDTVSVSTTPNENWRSTEAFEFRRRRGIGYFITHDMIEERQANTVKDLLVVVPGVWTSCRAGTCEVQMMASGKNCLPEWFLDGHPATNAVGPDFTALRIRGIEIYRSIFEVPPEFQRSNLRCGVIAIWTNMER